MNERVMQLIEYYSGGGKTRFAESIGVKQSTFSNAINRGSISTSIINKILETYPEVNHTWLLAGEGSMLKGGTGEPRGGGTDVDYEKRIAKLEGQIEILKEQNKELLARLQAQTLVQKIKEMNADEGQAGSVILEK